MWEQSPPSTPSVLTTPGVAGTLLQSHTPWARVHPTTCCISPLACDGTGRAGGTPEAMGPEVCGHCYSCHTPQPGDTCSLGVVVGAKTMTGLL